MNFSKLKMNSFLVIGRAGLDFYADPPGTRMEDAEHFYATVGGSAANIAVGIVRLSGHASLLTCVSDDAVGRSAVKKLKAYGVDTDYIRYVGGGVRNTLAVVETRSENCQSVIYRNGAADFEFGEIDLQGVSFGSFGALIFTGTSLAKEPSRSATFAAISRAKASGIPVVMDVDYRPYSWISEEAAAIYLRAATESNIVIGNDEEFAVMAGNNKSLREGLTLARHLANTSAPIVVYKMGERGSITFSRGQQFETPIFPVKALKPTGAGDAFMATFITSLASGIKTEEAVKRGSAAAAIVVSRVGCAPAMPTEDELKNFMSNNTSKI